MTVLMRRRQGPLCKRERFMWVFFSFWSEQAWAAACARVRAHAAHIEKKRGGQKGGGKKPLFFSSSTTQHTLKQARLTPLISTRRSLTHTRARALAARALCPSPLPP
jgi:hypothetical protein